MVAVKICHDDHFDWVSFSLFRAIDLSFDQPNGMGQWAATVFSFFLALWASFFLEFWKRRNNELIYDWGMDGWEDSVCRSVLLLLLLLSLLLLWLLLIVL